MTPDALVDKMRQYVEACERNDLGRRTRLENELDAYDRAEKSRLDSPRAIPNAAVWYARRGVAVFPCEPRGKRPITEHGLKDATTDVDKVIEWWTRTPAANIGAPTGLTFDVLDIDGPEGVSHTYGDGVKWPEEIGHSLTSRTAGHHVFLPPSGRGNTAGLFPSVDYRGRGGYVILPPSVGANGRRYAWTRPLKVAA